MKVFVSFIFAALVCSLPLVSLGQDKSPLAATIPQAIFDYMAREEPSFA